MLRFATANNGPSIARHPIIVTIEGTNCNDLLTCTTWRPLYDDSTALDNITNRFSYAIFETISSSQAFTSYRFLITQKRNNSELELYVY